MEGAPARCRMGDPLGLLWVLVGSRARAQGPLLSTLGSTQFRGSCTLTHGSQGLPLLSRAAFIASQQP